MQLLFALALLLPVILVSLLATYAYLDAPEYGMNPRKWAAISFFIPFFGFFAYLFERDDRKPEPEREEMFVDGPFEIHKSRADDTPLVSGSEQYDDNEDSTETGE
jgi:hypothetical protein